MTMEESRGWSELPSDILCLIISRLIGRDAESFHEVCQTWSLVAWPVCPWTSSPSIQLPSLIFNGQDSSQINLYNPVHNIVDTMDIPELLDAKIRSSKDGWLIMSQGKRTVFFFNPFTKEKIILPDLTRNYFFEGITFSSVPTSPDCIVFAVTGAIGGSMMKFSFIRHGEDNWHNYVVDNNYKFISSFTSPVFHNGVFYCLDIDGKLGEFDPNRAVEEENYGWTVLASPKELPCNSIKRSYLLESNGDLVSVLEGHIGKWVKVFKLDHSIMAWKMVTSLGNGMLFLSNVASLAATNRALQGLGMENNIYYPRFYNHDCVFHSLATGKFHTFRGGYAHDDGWYDATEKLYCSWIEPSFEIHNPESLQWHLSLPLSRSNILNICPLLSRSHRVHAKVDHIKEQQRQPTKRSLPPIPRLDPWLVFIHGKRGQQTFHSISEKSYQVKNIPEMRHKIICTCSHGWLVLLDKTSSECLLLNPMCMEKMQLPEWNFNEDPISCALLSPPNSPNCTILSIVEAESGFVRIVYCCPGDKEWIVRDLELLEGDILIKNVAAFGGKFYGLTFNPFNPSLVIIDLITTPAIKKVAYLSKPHSTRASITNLVESCGKLFLVRTIYRDYRNNIDDFEVFRMDFDVNAWVDVKSLGDRAFFLGYNNCCCSCSANESGIDGNKIYFISSGDRNLYEYSLKNKDIRPTVPCPNVISEWTTPVWVSALV